MNKINPKIGYYLAGFVDGEGSFNVSLRKRSDHNLGWQVVLTFNVSQKDKTILALLKKYLGCGRLQERKDGVWYYVVTDYKMINKNVIPFFEKFNFLSAKTKNNFYLFKKIAKILNSGEHLQKDGFKKIVELREKLNLGHGRKRKYSINNINN